MRRLALLLVLFMLLPVGGCTFGDKGGVTVLSPWTGAEGAAFQQVLDRFTKKTGIKVEVQGTRALEQVLTAGVQKGTPPDIAVLPSLGELAGYVRQGAVAALDDPSERSRGGRWVQLEQVQAGGRTARYAVAVKADLKSLIWYRPSQVSALQPGASPALSQLADVGRAHPRAWCLGMGNTPVSGWPGTDWIEDFVLHQAGPDTYRQWAAGRVAWSAPAIRQAFTAWRDLALAGQDAARVLLTDFSDAGTPMFGPTPGCYLHHQASFVIGDLGGAKLGTDVDAVAFPGRPHTWEVSANLAAMFEATTQARRLMSFLGTDEAQGVWPAVTHGGVFSAGASVDPAVYDNPVSRRIATTLAGTGGDRLCFDASDLMPAAMTDAFYRAVLEFVAAPDRLDPLLAQLEQVRQSIPAGEWLDVPC
jgi:alpha-glucoside transport system substrate-binding protein